MKLIRVTKENIDKEHICCAISSEKDCQVLSKKTWMKERFQDGLVFLKGDVRGKCFIEYIPAEKAWVPIEADQYFYINCLWIAGKYKGMGYSNELLHACMEDAKANGKAGLVALSSGKKLSYLADKGYLKYKGFLLADTCDPYFELMYLPFSADANIPKFRKHIKERQNCPEKGLVLYYTNQCPFTAKYVPILEKAAEDKNLNFKAIHIENTEEAQYAPTPFTTFSLFYDGRFITHEILSEKKFEKIVKNLL